MWVEQTHDSHSEHVTGHCFRLSHLQKRLTFIYDVLKTKRKWKRIVKIALDARENTPDTNIIETLSNICNQNLFIYLGGKMIEFLQQVLTKCESRSRTGSRKLLHNIYVSKRPLESLDPEFANKIYIYKGRRKATWILQMKITVKTPNFDRVFKKFFFYSIFLLGDPPPP